MTCFTLGASPAAIIAEKVGMKRPTTYLILENLVKRGFLSISNRNGVQQFNATDRSSIETYTTACSVGTDFCITTRYTREIGCKSTTHEEGGDCGDEK